MPTVGYASTTNLGVQLVMLRTRLGEPYDDAAEDIGGNEGYFLQTELIDLLYQAELRLAKDLVNDALVGLHTNVSRTTVNATATYDLPTTDITVADDPPVLRMIGVDLDTGAGLYPCRQISRKDLWKADDWGTHRAETRHPIMVYDAAGQITVRPTPTTAGGVGAGKLVFRYLKIPRRRYRHHRGIVDSVTSTSIFVDASAGIYPNDYWITDTKSAIRIVTGDLTGEDRMISDFAGTTGTFTVPFAFSEALVVLNEYIAGEISELGDHVGDMTLAWASYLGKQKIGEPQEAQNYLAEYQSGVKAINELYAGTRGGHVEVVAP